MKRNGLIKSVSLAWVALILLTACQLPFGIGEKVNDLITRTEEPVETEEIIGIPTELPEVVTPVISSEDLYGGKFADFPSRNVSLPEKYSGGYSLPLQAGQVAGINDFEFTAGQRQVLLENGFFVKPPATDPNRMFQEFYQAYESYRYDETPTFVTTDSIFHVYHLIFDKMLRDLETGFFISTLEELTTAMVAASTTQYDSLMGTELENAALRNVAYYAVPAMLLNLDLPVPAEAQALAEAEVELINTQAGVVASPIWNTGTQAPDEVLLEDYTQYKPRGHYTRSEALERYFRAMMWYGRMTFRLKDPVETQRALLTVQAMRNTNGSSGLSALELWQNIYDPTVFIVGKADDLSIHEYGKLSDEIFGASPQLTAFADPTLFGSFLDAAKKLPPPQINSMWVWIWQDRDEATQGFRFMGQRFTLDQFVFGELMWRKVGTLDNPRDLPKSLDLLAAMGSEEAYQLLLDMGENNYENYETQMSKTKQKVADFGLDSWTQNLYWSWLYALQPVFAEKGEQYPAFMRTKAWLRKDMHTALSSWTELKHDTILYAKQVMAEMGGGGPEEAPRGYVEPNPEAFSRLLSLAQMTRMGLENRGILDDTSRGNLDNLIDELEFLLDISQRELTGGEITDEDYWRIQYYGGWLEMMTIAAADATDELGGRGYLEDQKSALIADVATGVGRVLEEGVGYPTYIYVVIPDEPYRVAVGAVFTYYEFPVPQDQRMTDEEWRAMLEAGNAPDAPDWTSLFMIK